MKKIDDSKKVGIYVHIPFCKQKCQYCDYKLDYKKHLDQLAIIDTIYIGGGTPSFVDSKYIVEVMNIIKENFSVEEKSEITIEINPGTVTERKLQDYINAGINRISIGLQSTKLELFEKTYNLARKVGFKNINVDLMIGLPNQTIQDVEDSLNKIIRT